MKIEDLEHIGIAVGDLDVMVALFRDKLGFTCSEIVEYPEYNVKVAFFPVGNTLIEFIEGTAPDNEIRQFVEREGNALHHICLRVDDIGAALAQLDAAGVELKDRQPRRLRDAAKFAFIDPKSTGGVRLELYERI